MNFPTLFSPCVWFRAVSTTCCSSCDCRSALLTRHAAVAFRFCGSFQHCLPSAFPVEEIASRTRWCCFPDSIHPTTSSVVAWSFPNVFFSSHIICFWFDILHKSFYMEGSFCRKEYSMVSRSCFSPLTCLVSFVCLQFPFYLREPVLPCVRALCFLREHTHLCLCLQAQWDSLLSFCSGSVFMQLLPWLN